MFISLKYYKIQTKHWEIYIGIHVLVLYGLNGCGDDMKSHFIWDVNFKHAPNEKVPSLGL